jgi:hypothetical protein
MVIRSTALAPGEGATYQPSPPPQTDDDHARTQWISIELGRIADALNEGRQPQLRLDVAAVLPARPLPGLVCYFKAGVAGAAQGTYEFNGSAWSKL